MLEQRSPDEEQGLGSTVPLHGFAGGMWLALLTKAVAQGCFSRLSA